MVAVTKSHFSLLTFVTFQEVGGIKDLMSYGVRSSGGTIRLAKGLSI